MMALSCQILFHLRAWSFNTSYRGTCPYVSLFFMEQMVDTKFRALLDHSLMLLKKKWVYGILDDFVTKQLPNNVTWGLSLLYALEHKGDRALVSTQGEDLTYFST